VKAVDFFPGVGLLFIELNLWGAIVILLISIPDPIIKKIKDS
jgi:hypothetical protein